MSKDPGLAADGCIFMEAVSGDAGTHNSSGVWWLSPDIQLVGSVSGPDKADPGAANTVDVTLHNRGGNCTMPPGTESITIELWVGNPSLAMAPNLSGSTAHIDSIGVPVFGLPASLTHQFNWSPPSGLPASNPQSHGHKCLIARCYPDPLTPSASNFFVPDDPHVAQHNICIVPCGGPGAANKPGPCGVTVTSVNPDTKKPQRLRIRAAFDLEPEKFVRDVVLKRLNKTRGFKRLTPTPPRGFTVNVAGFDKAKVTDLTKPGGKRPPSYEVEITAAPGQLLTCPFVSNLAGAQLGDAYVFHLTQEGETGPQGGLTVVTMAI